MGADLFYASQFENEHTKSPKNQCTTYALNLMSNVVKPLRATISNTGGRKVFLKQGGHTGRLLPLEDRGSHTCRGSHGRSHGIGRRSHGGSHGGSGDDNQSGIGI